MSYPRRGLNCKCPFCEKPLSRPPSRLRDTRPFCSLHCAREQYKKEFKERCFLEAGRIFDWDQEQMGGSSRIYKRWKALHLRCSPDGVGRKFYFERGITVCKEWDTYGPFLYWAISSGFKNDLVIDRIDGRLGYPPSNCRFVTQQANCQNTSRNVLTPEAVLEARRLRSEGLSYKAIAEKFDSSISNIFHLIKEGGWSNV